MIKVGLIGYGLAGAVFHEPLIRACERLELTSVWTSREHPLRVQALDELLERADLVVVASPNQTHFELARTALEQGKHVIVDKPFTVRLDEADQLIAIAGEQQSMLTVFHNRRWDSDYLTVREIMPRLGDVLLFEAHWDRFRPLIKLGWRERPAPGAGLFHDLGPHMIDQALQLFGMPGAVSADIAAQREGAMVDDYFDVTLHYGVHRVCLRSSTLVADARPRFAVHGTEGSFVKHGLDAQEAQLKNGIGPRSGEFGIDRIDGQSVGADGARIVVPAKRGNYLAFYDAVADAILDGAPVPVSPKDARDGLALIDLACRASDQGRRLPVTGASSTAA